MSSVVRPTANRSACIIVAPVSRSGCGFQLDCRLPAQQDGSEGYRLREVAMYSSNSADRSLRTRAEAVLPNGMYGHQATLLLPDAYPQFFSRADGARIWDADGNCYLDYMCAYGPNLLGYRHKAIDAAYIDQLQRGDTMTGPSPLIVDLAEEIRRHDQPCGLGNVLQERHGRQFDGAGDRAGGHRKAQDPAGDRILSRRGAVVHAGEDRHSGRRPRASDILQLQRYRQPGSGGGGGRGRSGRDFCDPVQARHIYHSDAAGSGLCAAGARTLRCT